MSNLLIHETSPYLLQHANNPVHWHAWNEETLLKARQEDKMLLISIGYAACHWCHVMEHESFENEEVAKVMNENYICVKVDREERPDVDQVYMDAAYLINGNGGWPLNALALPDGKPFFAGTYFPKENWIRLLEYFTDLYTREKEKLEKQAAHLSEGIGSLEKVPLKNIETIIEQHETEHLFGQINNRTDKTYGGLSGNIKFPMPAVWEYVLQYAYFSGSEEAMQLVDTTLNRMAYGGIYDHVGGGFCRYSTDSRWHVPHFEKMLYDNAQLISLYSNAYRQGNNPFYAKITRETIDFVLRELTSPEGGFYSSLDADSEGEEGKFYTWHKDEIDGELQEDAALYCETFGITPGGNWEDLRNIPDRNAGIPPEKEETLPEQQWEDKIKICNDILLQKRNMRVRPATDDKTLTSWNALMITGLMNAGMALKDDSLIAEAKKHLDFLLQHIYNEDNSLFRNYKNGKSTIPAFLDDYAFLIESLIRCYQSAFEEPYLEKALNITKYVLDHFLDDGSRMFYYTNKDFNKLIARKMEVTDNVIPSSNSQMAVNLFLLGSYFEIPSYIAHSEQMVKNVLADIKANTAYYSNWARALLLHTYPVTEIAVCGDHWKVLLRDLQSHFLPGVLYSGGSEKSALPLLQDKIKPGKSMIYVCRNKTCKLPVDNVHDALSQV